MVLTAFEPGQIYVKARMGYYNQLLYNYLVAVSITLHYSICTAPKSNSVRRKSPKAHFNTNKAVTVLWFSLYQLLDTTYTFLLLMNHKILQ